MKRTIVDFALEWVAVPDDFAGLPLDDMFGRLVQEWLDADDNAGDRWRSKIENSLPTVGQVILTTKFPSPENIYRTKSEPTVPHS